MTDERMNHDIMRYLKKVSLAGRSVFISWEERLAKGNEVKGLLREPNFSVLIALLLSKRLIPHKIKLTN